MALGILCAGAWACGPDYIDPGNNEEEAQTASALDAAHGGRHGPRCREVHGTFTDVFLGGPVCAPDSPILLCTQGQLEGDLTAAYDFFFTSQTPVRSHGQVTRSRFTGVSHLTFPDGTLSSQDHGHITQRPQGRSPFVTQIEIVSGTGAWANTTGHLTATGQADFTTGLGGGRYRGRLCGLPSRHLVASAVGASDPAAQ